MLNILEIKNLKLATRRPSLVGRGAARLGFQNIQAVAQYTKNLLASSLSFLCDVCYSADYLQYSAADCFIEEPRTTALSYLI